ncbi:HAD-IIIA family hydrolase [Planktomarina temperata]|nr:HAD-IIIA family hydrolase [Planktomarina temperata]
MIFDRDGVLNKDTGYVHQWSVDLHSLVFSRNLIRWKKRGYRFIIVTNQSGIGRKYFTQIQFKKFQQHFLRYYKRFGISFDGIYYCPHEPSMRCKCRKPSSALIKQAIRRHKIDITKSIGIGDKSTDIQAFRNSGIQKTLLVDRPNALLKYEIKKFNRKKIRPKR